MTGKWLICDFYSADACTHVASARCAGRANRFDAVEYSSELNDAGHGFVGGSNGSGTVAAKMGELHGLEMHGDFLI